MLKKLSAFVLTSLVIAACGDAAPIEEDSLESIDTVELAAKPSSCPFSSQCPSNPPGYNWAYWYDYSSIGEVWCFYSKNSYPYNMQLIKVTDGGCGECCPGAAPCSNGPNAFKFYTCY